jgi:hypothetical protein
LSDVLESEHDRGARHARAAAVLGAALAAGAIAFALLSRYRPDLAHELIPVEHLTAAPDSSPYAEESAALAGSAGPIAVADTHSSLGSAPPDSAHDSASQSVDTTLPRLFALLQDTGSRVRTPTRRTVVTDVVLLPCSTVNPRPDGSIIIPPHNPKHRTIVGLPQKPGESPQGFVVPPHDPAVENQVPIRIIPMDSILAHTLRVPAHDPSGFSVVRPDSMSCLPDSGAPAERK